eukprot:g131.t1
MEQRMLKKYLVNQNDPNILNGAGTASMGTLKMNANPGPGAIMQIANDDVPTSTAAAQDLAAEQLRAEVGEGEGGAAGREDHGPFGLPQVVSQRPTFDNSAPRRLRANSFHHTKSFMQKDSGNTKNPRDFAGAAATWRQSYMQRQLNMSLAAAGGPGPLQMAMPLGAGAPLGPPMSGVAFPSGGAGGAPMGMKTMADLASAVSSGVVGHAGATGLSSGVVQQARDDLVPPTLLADNYSD